MRVFPAATKGHKTMLRTKDRKNIERSIYEALTCILPNPVFVIRLSVGRAALLKGRHIPSVYCKSQR